MIQLAKELKPINADPRIEARLDHSLTLVEGTALDAISTVAAATWIPMQDGTAKHALTLHAQFDFDLFIPPMLN